MKPLTKTITCLAFATGGYFFFDFVYYIGVSPEWVLTNFTHEGEKAFDILWGAVGALFGFSVAAYNIAIGSLWIASSEDAATSDDLNQSLYLLRELADLQNGPPLLKEEKQWEQAMNDIYELLEAKGA